MPPQYSHTKLVTPTRFTWVTYDREKEQILAVAGGTWTFQNGKYREVCDFASESHQHLRGESHTFTIALAEDKWDIKLDGADIRVGQAWNRLKPREGQTKNTEKPGQELIGAWERGLGPNAPNSARIVKYITPTHWTWVIYDTENKGVVAAMGGPWALKGDRYVETVAFTTDNSRGARGSTNPYGFEVDGDRWVIKRGPGVPGAAEEEWTRAK